MTDTYRVRNSARDLGTWPSREEIRALGAELDERYDVDHGDAELVRAALARWGRPTPQHPAAGEVAEVVEGLKLISDGMSAIGHESDSWFVARAAELLQSRHPQPVAVSERLPCLEDLAPWPDEPEAPHWCWFGSEMDGGSVWEQRPAAFSASPSSGGFSHWLPANALPTPEAQ